MSHLNRSSNGRPEPEVIVNFADGYAYSKGKMEEVFRSGLFDRQTPSKPKETSSAKKEDIELIVTEFEIPRAQAEKILAENDGDINAAINALITPQLETHDTVN